jgi:hypothetical protein
LPALAQFRGRIMIEAIGLSHPSLRMLLYRLRYDLRTIASSYPSIYLPIVRRMRSSRQRFIEPGTELVIEGFPRSGNTFTQAAFEFAQQRPVRTAHHLHAPAQVIEAVRHGIPTLIVIRPARNAVVAWAMTDTRLGLRQVLWSYLRYHRAIEPYVGECLVARFDQVTSDLAAVIRRINRRFSTEFDEFPHTPENVERVFAILRAIAKSRIPDRLGFENIPDPQAPREAQRKLLLEQFDLLPDGMRREADRLYERLAQHAAETPCA